ncbi:MAG: nucleoside-diphosphate kinase, partial [Syntrophobacteraceae bacterium]
KNSLTGYVLSQLSEFHTGLTFAATKIVRVTRMLAEEHYSEHRGKFFFPALVEMITGQLHFPQEPARQRTIAIVYQGPGAIQKVRDICGPTNPHVAREEKPGCIRSLGTVIELRDSKGESIGNRMDNLIHASANAPEAEREIKLWFKPDDFPPGTRAFPVSLSSEHFYFRDNRLLRTYEPGSVCLLAPGDAVWESDLNALNSLYNGQPSTIPLNEVISKYLLNRQLSLEW